MTGTRDDGWRTGCIAGLVVMATWTIVIKFIAPIFWAVSERIAGRPAGAPIMWDFWWVAHLALARLIHLRHPLMWATGTIIAAVEILIVAVKFAVYLRAPDLSFWKLLWFTNKVYVFVFFVWFLIVLMKRGRP
jgi:hypothetical protein